MLHENEQIFYAWLAGLIDGDGCFANSGRSPLGMSASGPGLHTSHELAGDAKSLQKAARHLPAARKKAQRLQAEAESALTESEALKLQARLEDLIVWERELVKESRKGSKTYA